jgi:hypothetical protein
LPKPNPPKPLLAPEEELELLPEELEPPKLPEDPPEYPPGEPPEEEPEEELPEE